MSNAARLPRRTGYLPVVLVLIFSLSLTVAAFVVTRRSEQRRRDSAFRQVAARPAAAMQESIYLHIGDLQSIGSFYDASQLVERDEFRSFVSGILSRRPALLTLEWVPRVPERALASFEAGARAELLTDFRIVELNGRGRRVPAGRREEYYPVWYAEPERTGGAALGLDLASDPRYHQALLQASARNAVAGTVPLLSRGGNHPEAYVALVLPIHRHDGAAQQSSELQGFVVAVLRIRALVEESLAKSEPRGVEVSLCDERAGAEGVQLYPEAGAAAGSSPRIRAGLSYQARLQVAGREWVMTCRPTVAYLASFGAWESWAVLGFGLILSGLLAASVTTVLGRAAWAERLVAERTGELWQANERLHDEVAERRRAEESLAARNRELESFVYMASHDLRTPLTSIEGFSRLLAESYADRLDAEGCEFLRRVRESATHMTLLVEDLLELSRVTSNREPKGMVPVGEVIAQVLDELHGAIADARAEIAVPAALPTIHASPTRLRQVFANLISNAIKFSREGVPPRLEIGWERTPEGYRFSVKDNGIGIAEEDRAQVFGIFTRLKEKEVAGTGIGLAIVKRIIEDHGGQVGVESTPGEGSTFWFTVPDSREANGERGHLRMNAPEAHEGR